MQALKSKLEAECKMMGLGEFALFNCLGVEFARDQVVRTITMSQAKDIGGGVEAVWHGGIIERDRKIGEQRG